MSSSLLLKNTEFIRGVNPTFIDSLPGDLNPWSFVYGENQKVVNLKNSESGRLLYPEGTLTGIQQECLSVERWKQSPNRLVVNTYESLGQLGNSGSPLQQSCGVEDLKDLTLESIHDINQDLEPVWATYRMSQYVSSHNVTHYPAPLSSSGCALVVIGMGLCQQLEPLIDFLDPSALFIVEPDLGILERSLELVDYEKLVSRFTGKAKAFDFITSNTPEQAVFNLRSLFTQRNLFLLDGCFSFRTFDTPFYKLTLSILNSPVTLNAVNYLGYFVDEVHMTMNAALNYFHVKPRVFTTDRVTSHQKHAIVVASGPSLAQNLDVIKKHREHITLFCCYSTIGKLLEEGIVPDFHCDLERHNDHLPIIEKGFNKALKNVTLCASSTCDPRLLRLYKDVICINRGALTPSVIFTESNDIIPNEGPDVATFAILSAIFLGYRKIHLFGVDLGTADRSQCRLEGALDIDRRIYDTPVRGNLGRTVFSSQVLLDNKTAIESNIAFYSAVYNDLTVYNYSNGVLIDKAHPSSTDDFIQRMSTTTEAPVADIPFVTYTDEHVRQAWALADMRNRCFIYLNRLRQLAQDPFAIETLYEVGDLCNALGKPYQDQIPIRFYRGSLFRSWMIVWGIFMRSTLPAQDEQDQMKRYCTEVLLEIIDSFENLTFQMLDYVESLKSLDEFRFESRLRRDSVESKPLQLTSTAL
jgi:hypothetical protein